MSPIVSGAKQGSRHKPRAMVALLPEVNRVLGELADQQKRPARWELHAILLEVFVAKGLLTQERADRIWQQLSRRQSD